MPDIYSLNIDWSFHSKSRILSIFLFSFFPFVFAWHSNQFCDRIDIHRIDLVNVETNERCYSVNCPIERDTSHDSCCCCCRCYYYYCCCCSNYRYPLSLVSLYETFFSVLFHTLTESLSGFRWLSLENANFVRDVYCDRCCMLVVISLE